MNNLNPRILGYKFSPWESLGHWISREQTPGLNCKEIVFTLIFNTLFTTDSSSPNWSIFIIIAGLGELDAKHCCQMSLT